MSVVPALPMQSTQANFFGEVWQRHLITDCSHYEKSESGKLAMDRRTGAHPPVSLASREIHIARNDSKKSPAVHIRVQVQPHAIQAAITPSNPYDTRHRHRDAIPAMPKAQNTCQPLAQRLTELPLDIYAA